MISPETLRRYPYFAGLPEEALKQVAMLSEQRPFKAGEHLFEESAAYKAGARLYEKGQEAKELMILVSGEVDLVTELSGGKEAVVASLVPGDLMAESSMVEPYQLSVGGVATREGSLIVIDAVRLRNLCQSDPAVGYLVILQIARLLLDRLQSTQVQLAANP
ncbi:MAG: Crp/Fnr family transcriptional regulator [Anaerolineales bacterium]|nr:Crp/Fnr family transcriptional regulator [Anaerolineales bacterium]